MLTASASRPESTARDWKGGPVSRPVPDSCRFLGGTRIPSSVRLQLYVGSICRVHSHFIWVPVYHPQVCKASPPSGFTNLKFLEVPLGTASLSEAPPVIWILAVFFQITLPHCAPSM